MDIFLLRAGGRELVGREVDSAAKYCLCSECDVWCLTFDSFAIFVLESWLSKELAE